MGPLTQGLHMASCMDISALRPPLLHSTCLHHRVLGPGALLSVALPRAVGLSAGILRRFRIQPRHFADLARWRHSTVFTEVSSSLYTTPT